MVASQICFHFPESFLLGKEIDGALATRRWRLEGSRRECFQAGGGFVRFGRPGLPLPRRLGRQGPKRVEEFRRGSGWCSGLFLRGKLGVWPIGFIGNLYSLYLVKEKQSLLAPGNSVVSWLSEASVCLPSAPEGCFSVPQETKWLFAQRDKSRSKAQEL